MTEDADHRRTIRSFVRRAGRMTDSQAKALAAHWPRYGLDEAGGTLDFAAIFGRPSDCIMEIGFGNGDTLVDAARDDPGTDFIGVEVHEPGIGHCLIRAADEDIENLRVIRGDAVEVLRRQVPDGSLAGLRLLFPDPWPKKRHHKRRIVQPGFVALVASRLKTGGAFEIATDWANYAEHIDEVMAANDEFRLVERRVHDGDAPLDRGTTKFERRGLREGHRIWDWRYIRT